MPWNALGFGNHQVTTHSKGIKKMFIIEVADAQVGWLKMSEAFTEGWAKEVAENIRSWDSNTEVRIREEVKTKVTETK
jgi:hypothetical protein